MSANLKINLINSIQFELSNSLDSETIKLVTNVLTVKLNDYTISEKCTEIVAKETESEQIVKMFLITKKIEGKSDKTIEAYSRRLADLMYVVNKPIKEMTIYDLRAYLAKKQQDGCSERTTSGYRAIMASFFNWAFGDHLIPENPVINLGVIKYAKEVKKPFSAVELELLRGACDNIRDRAIIETLLATGCRVGELVKIRVSDIDFTTKEIKIQGKGNKERIVYFNSVTEMWINKYLESRTDENPALFVAKKRNGNGVKLLQDGGVRAMLKDLGEGVGVKGTHPHRFRRTFATTMIKRDMSIQEVARIMGHANINTTMAYVYMEDASVRASYSKRVA